ncbi:MAG: hypothetical protein QG610_1545, partial [Euryarchaeota archaeon]|nr:hypothetical protein [Euryarchaeota archaeon]
MITILTTAKMQNVTTALSNSENLSFLRYVLSVFARKALLWMETARVPVLLTQFDRVGVSILSDVLIIPDPNLFGLNPLSLWTVTTVATSVIIIGRNL